MDRRGSGRSEAPPYGYELTVEDMLSDWAGFLDALGIPTFTSSATALADQLAPPSPRPTLSGFAASS